ncbi:hypothetical protein V6O07_17870, partial [Arthrospira platensis SPKY2]
ALLSREPAPIARAEIDTEERRGLVEKFRRSNPLRLPEGEELTLAFSPEELQSLLSWGALLVDREARAEVRATEEAMAWRASLGLPGRLGVRGHLSVGGEFAFESDGRTLR